jgi:membrane protease YdiL (CAAX protease family)
MMGISTSSVLVNVQPQARVQVRWGEVSLFVLLAYGLTWAWHAIWIIPHLGDLLNASTTPADANVIFGNPYYHIVGMFGPMLAAIIMRLFISREGLRGSLSLRRPWRYYLVAVFVPILYISAISLILALTGLARFALPEEQLPIFVIPLFALLFIFECVVAFGEEYGWRGYLLPRLLPLGEIKASLIVGIIWSLWHLPVLFAGVLYGGNIIWLVLLVFVFSTTMVTFAYTWLFVASRGSVMVATVFHGSTNWYISRLTTFMASGNLLAIGLLMGAGWLLIVLVVYGLLKRPPQVDMERLDSFGAM